MIFSAAMKRNSHSFRRQKSENQPLAPKTPTLTFQTVPEDNGNGQMCRLPSGAARTSGPLFGPQLLGQHQARGAPFCQARRVELASEPSQWIFANWFPKWAQRGPKWSPVGREMQISGQRRTRCGGK